MGQFRTPNFTIHFTDVPDGQFRANAIAQTCEQDLARLESLFQVSFQIGGLNRLGTQVFVISPPPSTSASNTGWGGFFRFSNIDINGDFAPLLPDAATSTYRAELARFLFVAELAEILMDAAHGGWRRGSSSGEALSIILGTELHPLGYYRGGTGAPRARLWLQASPRPDGVSSNDHSDQEGPFYGCGLLFINYLRHQLGYDLKDIIAAEPAWGIRPYGPTLAERFSVLTGRDSAQAYAEFNSLIERHLPQSRSAEAAVGTDNIFPLKDAPRSVWIVPEFREASPSTARPPKGTVEIQPGPWCPAKAYQYWEVEDYSLLIARGSCVGFAQATFEWAINGQRLAPSNWWASAQIPVDVYVPMPDRSHPAAARGKVWVRYWTDTSWNRSRLLIENTDHGGLYSLDVQAKVIESLVIGDPPTSASANATLPALHLSYDGQLGRDERRCNPEYLQFSHELAKLSEELRLIRVAPDPVPDLNVGAILKAAKRVQGRVISLASASGVSEEEFSHELRRSSWLDREAGLAEADELSIDLDVARAGPPLDSGHGSEQPEPPSTGGVR